MFYCNDCAKEKGWPISAHKSIGKCECCGGGPSCNDVPSSRLPKSKKKEAMYQGRRDDFDPRVDKVLDEGPKIDKAMADIEGALRELYNIKGKTINQVDFCTTFQPNVTATLYYLPKDWDYTKEHKESLEKLNQVCLDAYITFLECEREDLIKRWNNMAKELKP